MSIKHKLQRMKTHMNHEHAHAQDRTGDSGLHIDAIDGANYADHAVDIDHSDQPSNLSHEQQWQAIQAYPYDFDGEQAFIREIRFPLDFQHGNYKLRDLIDVVQRWNDRQQSHPLSTYQEGQAVQAQDFLFFDTETTGLGSGTGTLIFLLGYACLREDHVLVKQFFLPHPAAEVALYHAFLEDVHSLQHLVTYNGKAFDWPQVKTRHTFLREAVPALPRFGHFDLLHAARRLWKEELPSCRLKVVEEHKIGYQRHGDPSGAEVPKLYFDYLRHGDPSIVKDVLLHNERDVLSLITLYIHLSKLVINPHESMVRQSERWQIGRWFDHIGQTDQAIDCYANVAKRTDDQLSWISAQHALAKHKKKVKDFDTAVDIWEGILSPHSVLNETVLIELSKIYEHQYHDYDQAYDYAKQALDREDRRSGTGTSQDIQQAQRVQRLVNKRRARRALLE